MMCGMIVDRKKNENLDEIVHAEDFEGGKDNGHQAHDSGDGEEEVTGGGNVNSKKSKKLSKGRSKPREILQNGSFCPLILVCFLQDLCPFVNSIFFRTCRHL
jgi:hypothetical protein